MKISIAVNVHCVKNAKSVIWSMHKSDIERIKEKGD